MALYLKVTIDTLCKEKDKTNGPNTAHQESSLSFISSHFASQCTFFRRRERRGEK